jgi:pimeloyl-ACP methyl ester carboxylesterase
MAKARASRVDVGATASWSYQGDGPTILLIHGFRGDHHGLSAIAGALDGYQVLIPDLPGYGKSAEFADEHNLDNYAAWLVDYAEAIGTDVIVAGHSFGSLVVAAAHAKGLKSKATVLINPITTAASTSVAGKLAALYYRLGRLGWLGSYLLRSALVVRIMSISMATTGNWALRGFIHDQHLRYFSSYVSDRVALEGFEAANSGNVLSFAGSLPDNLLLIAGEKDLIAPLSGQLALQKVTGGRLETLPVGHLTHYETPSEVATLIKDFLGEP